MSLDQSILKSEILKIIDPTDPNFVGFPNDPATMALNWANAYDKYALSAVDISGDKLLTANKAGFIAQLTTLVGPIGTIVDAATIFDLAFVSYWTGGVFAVGMIPPFGVLPPGGVATTGIFSTETTSLVTTITPDILKNLLVIEFAILSYDSDTKADALATAFHIATTTAVIVTIIGVDTTPPPTGPLPIINISPIS